MTHERIDILLVDDRPDNLSLLRQMLTKEGYHVRAAINGPMAFQAIHKSAPDLILLDVVMPGMDGYEVCRSLKREAATQDIPVIFITALTDKEQKLKAFEVGGVDYITKPFASEEVMARVKTHATLRQYQCRLQQENQRFRQLEDAAFDGLVIHDQGAILDLNQAAETMFGLSREKAQGTSLLELCPEPWHEMTHAAIQADHDMFYTAEGLRRDGATFPVDVRSRSISWEGKTARVAVFRDLSRIRHLQEENLRLRAGLAESDHLGLLKGGSPLMQNVYNRIMQAAASTETVIIYGETGSGKELAARTIFELSTHYRQNFLPVNCAAVQESPFEITFFGYCKGAFTGADRITPGYFERAEGGTLFLDEVAELSLTMQAKLLRVLNDNHYTRVGEQFPCQANVRIMAATNRDLRHLVEQGRIREDFFHRIHVIALEMPPLRVHPDDIPLLVRDFLNQRAPGRMLPAELLNRFIHYDWPGNVRELFNELLRWLATGEVELGGAPAARARAPQEAGAMTEGAPFSDQIEALERRLLAQALTQTGGNQKEAAALLQMPRITLLRKIKKYGLT